MSNTVTQRCPRCGEPMKSLATTIYCDCASADDFENAPTRPWASATVSGSLVTAASGACAKCGSTDIEPFELNGATRKHCWGCGAVSAQEMEKL